MRFLFILLIILPYSNPILSQKATIDSLRTKLHHTSDVQTQINIELELTGLFAQQNIDSTKKYGLSALQKAKKINNKLLQCQSYLKLIFGYGNISITPQNDTTWLYLDLARRLAEEIDYSAGIARINNVKGVLYFQKGEFEKGITHYLLAEKQFEELKDTLYAGYTKNNIGNYYNYAKKYDKALGYLIQSKEIFIRFKQDFQLFSNLSNIISIYVATQDTINVIKAIDEYYPMAQNSEYADFKILSTAYWGIRFSYLKNNDSAEYHYKKAIDIAESLNKSELVDRIYINLGTSYFQEEKWDEAEAYYQHGLEIARKTKSYQTELMALDYLSKVYQKKGRYKEALQYLSSYKHLLDSTKIEFSGNFAEKALSEQELKEKTEELARLRTEQEEMIKRSYIIIIFVFASISFFLLIWYIHAGVLYSFAKSTLSGNKPKSLWLYIPPSKMPGNYTIAIQGVLFLLLNAILCFTLYKEHITEGRLMLWYAFIFIAFFVSTHLLFRIIVCKKVTLKKEVMLYLSGAVLLSLIFTATALLFKPLKTIPEHYLFLSLLTIANLFIILSLTTFVQYRVRFSILSENRIASFNKKLKERIINAVHQHESQQIGASNISIEDNGKQLEINLHNLIYIVSDNVYQEFISLDGEKITTTLIRNTMGNIEKRLTDYRTFLRCHRSYIINTNRITSIIRQSRQYYFVLDKTDEKIPISRNAENEILERFTNYLSN